MSKIQDLLAAQRSKQNGSTSQPVLQSKPAETAKPVEAQRPLTLQEKLAKKSAISSVNTGTKQANGIGISEQSSGGNSVVEQGFVKNEPPQEKSHAGQTKPEEKQISEKEEIAEEIMPPGLSLLQQMKWKKEHAPKNVSSSAAGLDQKNSIAEAKPISQVVSPQVSQQVQELSASQSADALKQNDGLANIEELRRNLLYLANNIENKDIVSGVIRTIGLQLKNSPELTPHMTNADVNLVVRGARSAYQLAAMAKQSKEDNKKGKSKAMGEVDLIFKDAGIDFSALNFKG